MSSSALSWRNAMTAILERSENFHSVIGLNVLAWEKGLARLSLAIRPEHGNGGGSVHGGVLMGLLDTASGLSGIYADEGETPCGCATVALSVKFIKPAISGLLTVEARRQSGGKSLYFTYAEIRDEANDMVATADGTFHYLPLNGEFAAAAAASA